MVILLGFAAGTLASALLYLAVGGLAHSFSAEADGASPDLWSRALQFGAIFGIAPGGLLGLGLYRAAGGTPHLPALAKIIAVIAVAAAVILLLTGGRWNAIFGGFGGFAGLLVLGWIALAFFLPRFATARAFPRKAAGGHVRRR